MFPVIWYIYEIYMRHLEQNEIWKTNPWASSSQQISDKNFESKINIAMKSFPKLSHLKWTLNCLSRRSLVSSVSAYLLQKPGFVSQVSHQIWNTKNISSTISSQQISGKNLGSKSKYAMEKLWHSRKNLSFGVYFKL